MIPTVEIDAARVLAKLQGGEEINRNLLLHLCGESRNRLGKALAYLRNRRYVIDCVQAGRYVGYVITLDRIEFPVMISV